MVRFLTIFSVTICILAATGEKGSIRRTKLRSSKAISKPIDDRGNSDIPGIDAILKGIGGDVDPKFAVGHHETKGIGPCRPVPLINKRKRKDRKGTKDKSKSPNVDIFPVRFGWDITPKDGPIHLPPCPPNFRGRSANEESEYYEYYEDGSPTPTPTESPEVPVEDKREPENCDNKSGQSSSSQDQDYFPNPFGWLTNSIFKIAHGAIHGFKNGLAGKPFLGSGGKPACKKGRPSPRHVPIKLKEIWDEVKPSGVFAGVRDKLQSTADELKKGFHFDLKPHEYNFHHGHQWRFGSKKGFQGGNNFLQPLFSGTNPRNGGDVPLPQAPEDIQPPVEPNYYLTVEDMNQPEYVSDHSYSEGGSMSSGKTWSSTSVHVRTDLEQPEARYVPLKEIWKRRPGKHIPKRKPKQKPTYKFHILKNPGEDAPV